MKKFIIASISILSVLLFFLNSGIPDEKLDIYFLNVGQGDSILIRTPFSGHNILIDGGPDDSILSELGDTLPFYDRQIDLMVLTHPHADHLNGLLKVLENYKVKSILITGEYTEDPAYHHLFEQIQNKRISVLLAHSRQDIKIGSITLDILFPDEYLPFQKIKNSNNASIAMSITYTDQTILLTGDSEIEELEHLFSSGKTLKADIFKAAHHGSKTGIFPPTLKEIDPKIVIIQSGQGNRFGHPHKETLEYFEKKGVEILRNDESGRIVFSY